MKSQITALQVSNIYLFSITGTNHAKAMFVLTSPKYSEVDGRALIGQYYKASYALKLRLLCRNIGNFLVSMTLES